MKLDRMCALVVVSGLLAIGACSGGGGDPAPGTGGQGGTMGGTTGGTSGGTGGASTGGTMACGATVAVGGSGGSSTTAPSTWPNVGVCGERGGATADATSFDGYEERYIIGEQGFGSSICVVRFDLKRVGDAPPCCTVCTWTQMLEYSNPSVVTDTDGVCTKSDLALNQAAISKIVGSRVSIGFAKQLGGAHGSARMKFIEDTKTWEVDGNATWNEPTKAFKFDYRSGVCNYGP